MAVEMGYLNCIPPPHAGDCEIMNPSKKIRKDYNSMAGVGVPLSTTTAGESLFPDYNLAPPQAFAGDLKFGSGVTYNVPLSRKRMRDSVEPFLSYPVSQKPKTRGFFSYLDQEVELEIHNHNMESRILIDRHMERVVLEMEERQNKHARTILQEIESEMAGILRTKQIEIEKIGKMNWELEEKVKSLSFENQIWRDQAQTNEATVIALRTNLEQLLWQKKNAPRTDHHPLAAPMDSPQSGCGSNGGEQEEEEEEEEEERKDESSSNGGVTRRCRNCGEDESCVLLLPCRHLCLCAVCGSKLHICPICKSTRNTTVHINL